MQYSILLVLRQTFRVLLQIGVVLYWVGHDSIKIFKDSPVRAIIDALLFNTYFVESS